MEVILRLLVVVRVSGWSDQQAEFFVCDRLVLSRSAGWCLQRVSDDTTLIRWANTIGLRTVQTLKDWIVQLAWSLEVTRSGKLCVDTPAVETSIHRPTDSVLLGDGMQVRWWLLKRAQVIPGRVAKAVGPEAFRSGVRTVCAG